MIEALHIVDEDIRPDMLTQLELLAAPDERIVSAGPPPRGLTRQTESVHCTMGSPRLAAWRIRDRLGNAEIIHAWSEKALLAGRELALTTGRAMVYSIPTAPIAFETMQTLTKAVGPGLLNVTVPTDFARRRLLLADLPERFCHVLAPAAVAADDPAAARARVRKELGIPNDTKLLVSPDPFVRYVGHEYASWSHAILRHIPLALRLAFCSSGPLEEHYRFFAATTGFDEEVYFTREQFTETEMLSAADIAVLPQTQDCGALMMAAAMAAGTAIAASGMGSLTELSSGGECAMQMGTGPRQTSAALLKLAEDDAWAQRLARAGSDKAREQFAPTVVAEELQEIYARAIETKAF